MSVQQGQPEPPKVVDLGCRDPYRPLCDDAECSYCTGIRALVAEAPPLSAEQKARLSVLLGGRTELRKKVAKVGRGLRPAGLNSPDRKAG